MTSLFNLIVTTEYLTLIAAILFLNKKRTGVWQLFIGLLFVIVSAETIGWYWYHILHKSNLWIFNINLIVTDLFILWILSTAECLLKVRRTIYIAIGLFALLSFINLFFFQGFFKYNQYTETTGDVLQIIICCYLFYSLLTEESYRNLFTYEYFWLGNGVLFSSLGSTILYISPDEISAYYKQTHINVFVILNNILNLLLYGSLIIAFICRNRNTR